MLTLAGGGWVLVLAGLLGIWIFLSTALPPLLAIRDRPPGDGENPGTYGFDLASSSIDPGLIVAAQYHRDIVPSLHDPAVMAGTDVVTWNEENRGKHLVSRDLVVGVVVGGEARAYPLQHLRLHEIVNDELGGVPLLVTFHPICGSMLVFDRRVGGEARSFGHSGLLLYSNQLLYDHAADAGTESLWCQVTGKAVTGTAAAEGLQLQQIPATVMQWQDWLASWPGTTVLAAPSPGLRKRQQATNYDGYLASEKLLYPVPPLPEGFPLGPKTPCLLLETTGGRMLLPLASLTGLAGEGQVLVRIGPDVFRVSVRQDPACVSILEVDSGIPAPAIYLLAFAWHAFDLGGDVNPAWSRVSPPPPATGP